MNIKTILITLGDPNGLGPELVCRWLARNPAMQERLVLIGPGGAMRVHAKRLGLGEPWTRLEELGSQAGQEPGLFLLEPQGLGPFVPEPGTFTTSGGLAAGLSLSLASDLLLDGRAQALVTCPPEQGRAPEGRFRLSGTHRIPG